ncbi:tail fiber domain-containing protein, partial [Inquilinus sp.]|uniref:tail fiber domain-containing protein n=1 Tax=Inquilinus sp. TaxID=1932117 RepID=UPI0031E38296
TGLQARNQLVNEALALSGRGAPQTASAPQSSSPSIQAPDIQGAMQDQYKAQLGQWQQQQQNAQAGLGGLFNLGAAALGGWATGGFSLSDIRLKTNIRQVGETEGGIPLYEFRYRAGGPPQIGVMAQDVERLMPAAVVEIGGLKHVDYLMVA